ncbi:DUF2599 domain-containing protein [Cellulosimicrobium sp. XJ-DQ-B-000]|uniref:DUF2599 domain-containing protein n=1 Tax=Cellulosimicrobium sp. XJ-DQ-B-000 TaxID=3072182 RepID=UPI002809592A|nr:DUF2599 domain-containing protein [Cellulosimicrobium sp. XJ-DQ-B-000]MDQ8041284.1 DUF2599 domain-containing protein [Cellulosimicrobium sp. XJ-DQ-B-000]
MTRPRRVADGRPGTTVLGALAVGVLVPVALAACTPGTPPPDPDVVTSAPARVPSPGPGATTEDGRAADDPDGDRHSDTEPASVRVPVGTATVELAVPPPASGGAAPPRVTADAEGASDVTLALAGAPAVVSVEGGSLVRHPDGTLTVLDDGSTPVGGLGAPRVVGRHGAPGTPGADGADGANGASGAEGGTADGTDAGPAADTPAPGTPRVRVALVDAHRAEVTLVGTAGTAGTAPGGDDAASAPDGDPGETTTTDAAGAWEVVVPLGTRAVRSTDWGEREGGRSLAVDPTAWARAAGQAGQELVWAQVVAAEPEADTPTMHDQLVCHAVGTPDKATWNLEPWRPDVGLLATMSARCNPA